ncbi:glycosyltransferase family 4 protein [Actinoplanes sp. TRM 88003]|uniref:Glycosyltransferase family 4 protein n=1 Tax=Paractinoplanes aksuensis TaxID=2939490 RepID=A0ABT1DLP7_9ACTN|nr:glycosyltransferase family 4 protein [Actinoplanes aksuensis]MCO8271756.1 glycosyltransferase family 4 protein [Actinoplanes aksuensis]
MIRDRLNVLVYPHDMAMGGSQLNAIELAAATRDLGHQVTVVGDDGPLVRLVRELGLRHIPVSSARRRPSPAVARQLRRLVHEEAVDVVHGYEWPPGLEAAAAAFPLGRAAAVCTVMSMSVAPFLPRSMPLVVGTRAIQERAAAGRPGPVHLIEPPVDVVANAPGHPVTAFRTAHDLAPGPVEVVVVCRLVPELKLEGVLTAVDVIGELARDLPLRLTVVGDGTARATVEEHAAKANARAGRRAVVLTGEIFDPRPAYAMADIMLGMGGSALRSLAFGRPLVVQGEKGFWELLTTDSVGLFLQQGWYGVGDGSGGAEQLAPILRALAADQTRRNELGAYGRRLADERFSLARAAVVQEEIYAEALAAARSGPSRARQSAEALRSMAGVTAHKLRRRYRALRGTRASEDFNQVTLARQAATGSPTERNDRTESRRR